MNQDIDNIRSSEIKPNSERDYRCAPSKQFKDGSCITLNGLVALAEGYNKTYDDKIKLKPKLETINPSLYKKYLIKQFNKRLDNVCDNQRCWLKQDFVKNVTDQMKRDLLFNTYRPKGPQGKFTWLNTLNINDVMKQYEDKYKDFLYLGTVPADFDDLPYLGIKNLNFDDLIKKGKTKIGIIFNLDNHNQDGSHWVSLYSDIKNGKIYFSDSYGLPPEPRFRKLMRRIARYSRHQLNIPEDKLDIRHNKTRHQRGNSECGVYSINFILRNLKGDTFDKIVGTRISDDNVNKCRKVYFT
jgi:hypothetical protein